MQEEQQLSSFTYHRTTELTTRGPHTHPRCVYHSFSAFTWYFQRTPQGQLHFEIIRRHTHDVHTAQYCTIPHTPAKCTYNFITARRVQRRDHHVNTKYSSIPGTLGNTQLCLYYTPATPVVLYATIGPTTTTVIHAPPNHRNDKKRTAHTPRMHLPFFLCIHMVLSKDSSGALSLRNY